MAHNRRKKKNNKKQKQMRIIRCKIHNRPMFQYEVCTDFSPKNNSNDVKNCENCIQSF